MCCGKPFLTICWVFFCTLFLYTPVFSQVDEAYNPVFEVFELPGGSPNNQVQQVIQDTSGYLWFASVGGLHRWDGHNFKSYVHDPEDPSSISFNYVERLFIDSKGGLWVGMNGGGLNFFDASTETFIRYEPDSTNPGSISEGIVNAISEDTQGNIWVATRGGLNRLDLETQKFTQYLYNPNDSTGISGSWIWELAPGEDGEMWLGVSYLQGGKAGLNRYDPKTNSFTWYLHDSENKTSLTNDTHVAALLKDSQGRFWVPAGPVLHQMDTKTGDFMAFPAYQKATKQHPSFKESWISCLMEAQSGHIWIGNYSDGLHRYDPQTGKVDRFTADSNIEGSIATDLIWNLFQSRDGTIWVLTGTQGAVMRIRPNMAENAQKISLYPLENYDPSEEPFMISSIDSAADIWLSTYYRGLIQYNSQQGIVNAYTHDSTNPNSIAFDRLGWTYEDRRGDLWITFRGRSLTLDRFNKRTQTFTHVIKEAPLNILPTTNYPVFDIIEDSSGILWMTGQYGGITKIDPFTLAYTNYPSKDSSASRPSGSLIQDMIILPNGDFAICGTDPESSSAFLDRFNPTEGTFTPIPLDKGIIRDKNFYQILVDREGNWWVVFAPANYSAAGLLKMSTDGEITEYSLEKGNFPVASLIRMTQAADGSFWMVPPPGDNLLRFDPITEDYMYYILPEGLYVLNFFPLIYSNLNGQIAFGTTEGIGIFDTQDYQSGISPNHSPIITDFRIYSQSQKPSSSGPLRELIQDASTVYLSHREKAFGFHFSIMDFLHPEEIEYYYRLSGYEEAWNQTLSIGEANYVEVPPGTYELQVKAMNAEKIGSPNIARIQVIIAPPWWQTTGAYVMYGLLGLCILGISIYFYSHAQRKRISQQQAEIQRQEEELIRERKYSERLKHVDALKDQFLANTSHELRTPLQGIIGLAESLVDRVDDPDQQEDLDMVISSAKRLNSLVNDILDFSKLKNFDIELSKKPLGVSTLVDIVLKNNAPLIKGKEVQLINQIPNNLPLVSADENRLQQILYNLIGNAIKFTENGKITVGVGSQYSEGHEPEITERPQPLSTIPSPPRGNSKESGLLTLYVQDTGIGIPEEKRQSIFQAFEQGDGSISRDYVGTGLGLSISKHLIELHGGTMWVESEVGKGSTFYFTLPKAQGLFPESMVGEPQGFLFGEEANSPSNQSKAKGTNVIPSPSINSTGEEGFRILVVDDEPINQQVLKNHLSEQGFHITRAMNGKEAMRALEEHASFDLVLLDVMMPRMSGYEVCEKIREKFLPSELPIIMVTAKDQLRDVVQGLTLGANDYLPKPFHKDELLARIKTQLDLRRIFGVSSKFVPNEFLRSLNKERITEVALGDHTQKEVTVLFADIRGYTALAETMSPEENFGFVNAFHGRMGPIIKQHKGFVNQYLGDAIMAIFPENPRDALEAAVAMQQKLHLYNTQRLSQGRKPIKLGIGLHTGPLIMGIIGDQGRMDAATIADSVNTASRIENLTKYYSAQILLSEDCLHKMENQEDVPPYRYLGKVRVKGKVDPLKIYECLAGAQNEKLAIKLATQDRFEQGLKHYWSKEFVEAAGEFSKLLKVDPEDRVAEHFLKKASRYILDGVPPEWDGVEEIGLS